MDSKIIYLTTIEKAGPLRWSNRRLARRVNRDLGEGRERLPTGSSEGEAGWENLRINRVGTSESKDTENTEQRMSCLQFDKHSMFCVTSPLKSSCISCCSRHPLCSLSSVVNSPGVVSESDSAPPVVKMAQTKTLSLQWHESPSGILLILLIDSLRSPFGLPEAVFLRCAPILSKNPLSASSW